MSNEVKKYFDEITFLKFTSDSKILVYVVRNGYEWTVMVNEVEGRKYESISPFWGKGEVIFDDFNKFHYLGFKNRHIYLVEEEIVNPK